MEKDKLEKMVKYLAVSLHTEYVRHYPERHHYDPQTIIDRTKTLILREPAYDLWIHKDDYETLSKDLKI